MTKELQEGQMIPGSKMKYSKIKFPEDIFEKGEEKYNDEGEHYEVERYGGDDVYNEESKWIEWWYFNGILDTINKKTKEKKRFGYMSLFLRLKDDSELIRMLKHHGLVPQGNMLICDLDSDKIQSYFSARPLSTDRTHISIPLKSTFSKTELEIKVKGFKKNSLALEGVLKSIQEGKKPDVAHVEEGIDNDNYYNLHRNTRSTNKKAVYKIENKGRAVIEPGKIDEDYYMKIFSKHNDRIRIQNPRMVDKKEINKQARSLAFEEIREKYSNMELNLSLERDLSIKPLLINGNGAIKMGGGGVSYYYTFPHLKTSGEITVGEDTFEIVKGDSWMDHQWGDFGDKKFGWQWFSIRLDNGIAANVFIHVDQDSNVIFSDDVDSVASMIMPDGSRPVLKLKEVLPKSEENGFTVRRAKEKNWEYNAKALSDHSGINAAFEGILYPQKFVFDFRIGGKQLSATIESKSPLQYGYWYWEGFSDVEAHWMGKRVLGFSGTELWFPATPSEPEGAF